MNADPKCYGVTATGDCTNPPQYVVGRLTTCGTHMPQIVKAILRGQQKKGLVPGVRVRYFEDGTGSL